MDEELALDLVSWLHVVFNLNVSGGKFPPLFLPGNDISFLAENGAELLFTYKEKN